MEHVQPRLEARNHKEVVRQKLYKSRSINRGRGGERDRDQCYARKNLN